MKKKMSLIIASMLLASFAGAEDLTSRTTRAVEYALSSQIALATQQNELAARLDLHTASMQWKRCDILQYRQRRDAALSKAGIKQIRTGCETVVTRCNAIVQKNNIIVSAACFYPEKNKNQTVQLVQSHLLTSSGIKQNLSVSGAVKDFVILANR